MPQTKQAIAVIGAGLMGAALVRAFVAKGHPVTVWNRTREKCEPLRREGASVATSTAEVAAAADIVVVCIRNYAATRQLLRSRRLVAALKGKTLVQLCSGTPKEARALSAWAEANGVAYLDGAIIGYPTTIGTERGAVLYAGPTASFQAAESSLQSLGGAHYVGTAIGAASALDMAWLGAVYAQGFGFYFGAALCESEQVPIARLLAMLGNPPGLVAMAKQISANDFTVHNTATMRTHAAIGPLLTKIARENGLDGGLARFLSHVFGRGLAAGRGDDEIASLVEVMRKR